MSKDNIRRTALASSLCMLLAGCGQPEDPPIGAAAITFPSTVDVWSMEADVEIPVQHTTTYENLRFYSEDINTRYILKAESGQSENADLMRRQFRAVDTTLDFNITVWPGKSADISYNQFTIHYTCNPEEPLSRSELQNMRDQRFNLLLLNKPVCPYGIDDGVYRDNNNGKGGSSTISENIPDLSQSTVPAGYRRAVQYASDAKQLLAKAKYTPPPPENIDK